jgi:membrane protease subunit HflK
LFISNQHYQRFLGVRMGWNDPDKGDKGKNSWGDNKSPPDLDEALTRAMNKLKGLFLGKVTSGGSGTNSSAPNNGTSIIVLMFLLVVIILWALSGIFIVGEGEQAAILRFGKYIETVGPGPHWIPRFIESRIVVNVGRVSDYSYSAQMLTQDTNLVSVSVAVKYQVRDVPDYLFNVASPEESLRQATSSALRQVVGTTTLEQIITEGQEAWGQRVQETLIKILDLYKTGLVIVKVDPQSARAPENVQDAFDDAIKAREDEKRFKARALAYRARVLPIAKGRADRIKEEAKAFAQQVVLKAKGEVAEFLALLPVYLQSPGVTSERMYLESVQQVLIKSRKIIVDGRSGNMLYLPLDKVTSSLPSIPTLMKGK